jgi:hypothetical protein
MSKSIVSELPTTSCCALILSPQIEIHTFLGYCPSVSTMISCFFHSPLFPVPVWTERR